MWVIRPFATTRLTAESSSPARSIRTAGAPFSQPHGADHRIRYDRTEAREQGRHPVAAHHRTPESGHLSAAVGDQYHVGCEHVEQHLEITAPKSRQEPVDHPLVLGTIDPYARPTGGHVLPCPVSDLPDSGRRLVDRLSDVGVGHIEDLAQHEDRPFGRA
jgi:hypothetical protein